MKDVEKKTLLIKVPKSIENSSEKFISFFDDLHKFIKSQSQLSTSEKVISCEVLFQENYFHYRLIVSRSIISVISSLLYSKFKDVEIIEEEQKDNYRQVKIAEFKLLRSNFFPLQTIFSNIKDPYIIMSAILSKLEHFSEGLVLQIVITPYSETWMQQFLREKFYFVIGTLNQIKLFIEEPFLERQKVNYYDALNTKFSSSLFTASVRIIAFGENNQEIEENFRLLRKAVDKYNNGDINKLTEVNINQRILLSYYYSRTISPKHLLLNTNEIAALFHFPDSDLNISGVYQISSEAIEPPKELPIANFLEKKDISVFGITNFRSQKFPFGVRTIDRNRHVYIIGKTGMGKSKLIELLVLSNIHNGSGLCVIDPHGDLANDILKLVPKERLNDVIYFNPADSEYAIGFNPLECHSPEAKHQVVSGFISIFKKLFSSNWTNRLEHMLRFTVLALLETNDATVIDIVKLLTDIKFRQGVVKCIKDPVVKNFWTHEFASWNEKFDNEAIIPLINQVGQFISNEYIRNVVSQRKSAIDFYSAMNENKIIIINIAKGKLGEENSSLLGSMIITKIQEATMARVNIPEGERKEFYLYVDEFQNFATESFNQILSEARKFNLSLTVAHQYIDQLSDSIRKTIFGNVGSIISFRVGPEDTKYLDKEFSPDITGDDLLNLDVRSMYVKISIDGRTSKPFSAVTIDVPGAKEDNVEEIIRLNRSKYYITVKALKNQLSNNKEVMNMISKEDDEKPVNFDFEEPLI